MARRRICLLPVPPTAKPAMRTSPPVPTRVRAETLMSRGVAATKLPAGVAS
jgi:hypothetical protein